MFTLEKFKASVADVVNWNAVARDGVHDFSQEAIVAQTAYVHEELMETLAAIIEGDVAEIINEVADVFVTVVYKDFLLNGSGSCIDDAFNSFAFTPSDSEYWKLAGDEMSRDSVLTTIVSSIAVVNACKLHEDESMNMVALLALLESVEHYFNVDMTAVIQHVSEANWSKFPRIVDTPNPDEVAAEIERVRGKKDVSYYAVEGDDCQARYVFRDNGGKGKIMKPLSYKKADCSIFL